MPNDRVPQGPLVDLPEQTRAVRPLTPWEQSLASRLVPVVDRISQLRTRFGLRPYRVFLVHIMWTGGRSGRGDAQVISRREILPTPRVTDMTGTTQIMRSIGLSEEGGILIDQISVKYAEDDLTGRTPDMADPAQPLTGRPDVEFAYEVQEWRTAVPEPARRYYVPSSVPMLSKGGFQWKVVLTKRDYNPSRQGDPNRPQAVR